MNECMCGCGGTTNATFCKGHDEMVRAAVMYLLGPDTMALCRIFGFGPGLRNAATFVREMRQAS